MRGIIAKHLVTLWASVCLYVIKKEVKTFQKCRAQSVLSTYHHRIDDLVCSVEFIHVVEEVLSDGFERGLGPLAEPVNGAAIHQRRELSQSCPEYLEIVTSVWVYCHFYTVHKLLLFFPIIYYCHHFSLSAPTDRYMSLLKHAG